MRWRWEVPSQQWKPYHLHGLSVLSLPLPATFWERAKSALWWRYSMAINKWMREGDGYQCYSCKLCAWSMVNLISGCISVLCSNSKERNLQHIVRKAPASGFQPSVTGQVVQNWNNIDIVKMQSYHRIHYLRCNLTIELIGDIYVRLVDILFHFTLFPAKMKLYSEC